MRVLWILLIALVGVGTGYLVTRFERSAPEIRTPTSAAYVSQDYTHEFRISDRGTGLEALRIWLEAGDREYELVNETYPGNVFTGAERNVEQTSRASIDPKELGLDEGPAKLHARARDWSWGGNTTEVVIDLTIDTRPPRISLATGLTYVRRGGSEMVVYTLGEEPARHGVKVGEQLFPGFPHPADPGRYVAMYALPPDVEPGVQPTVFARDRAGNESSVGMTVELIDRKVASDTIRLSDGFMKRKAAELLGATNGTPALESYLKINNDMRRANAERIREITAKSSAERLWEGPFLQLPNSEKRARFAEQRSYVYQDQPVDKQVHLGLDLASTSHARVPAANDGVVVFGEDLGIYGLTVILDHGLGLFSLYGHLSEIAVEKGQPVARGDELGRTGTTGLAGGDHLHYSMLVSGVFVDPMEWLDGRWIKDHIDPKLAAGEAEEL